MKDESLLLKNAHNLRLFMRQFDKRTDPANAEPDMRELGQDVGLMCLMMHKYRRQLYGRGLLMDQYIAALIAITENHGDADWLRAMAHAALAAPNPSAKKSPEGQEEKHG